MRNHLPSRRSIPARLWSLLLFGIFVLVGLGAGAATPSDPKRCSNYDATLLHAPYAFQYGVTPNQLQKTFYGEATVPNDGSYSDNGYRPVRVTGYVDGSNVLYATKWVKDGAGPWTSMFGLTSAEFNARYLDLKAQGFRMIDASAYVTAQGLRFADVWVKNSNGIAWEVTSTTPAGQMDGLENAMRAQGLAPIRTEGYVINGITRFVTVWEASSCQWALEQNLSGAQYQAFFNANIATMRPVHVDGYTTGSQVQYATIFWKQNGPAVRASHGQHWYLFQQALNDGSCDGFAPDSFYGVEHPDGFEGFGGIWSYRGAPGVTATSPLATRVAYQVNCANGRAGAAFINLTTGESVMAHADQAYGSASAIKIAVLYGLLRKVDAEQLDMSTTEVDGLTLTTLATTMIQNSSNSATNTLIDYVGRTKINDQLAALGLKVVRVNRYLTGGPSAYGLANWYADFRAGYDNFVTPRELATLWRKLYENDGLLSANAYQFMMDVTDLANTLMTDALPANYEPNWVEVHDKPGKKDYNGAVVGDFAHRPQLGEHKVTSEGGVMLFGNGQVVAYAAIIDQSMVADSAAAIACTGWEVAKNWAAAGADEGDGMGFCDYP